MNTPACVDAWLKQWDRLRRLHDAAAEVGDDFSCEGFELFIADIKADLEFAGYGNMEPVSVEDSHGRTVALPVLHPVTLQQVRAPGDVLNAADVFALVNFYGLDYVVCYTVKR
jgi:hypothetical protein